jgi:flagellar basal-body rod protein FlgB
MFNKINQMFDFHQKSLNLCAKRQEILAANIANADTPGYKSIDFNFSDELSKITKQNTINKTSLALKTTSLNHLYGKNNSSLFIETIPTMTNKTKIDGNTVDMNRERIEFLKNSLKYESSLAFLKNEIKNIMSVLKG